jgi:hypothetical protein
MLRANQASPAPTAPRFVTVSRAIGGAAVRASVPVRYLGAAPIVVRGAVTGHAYRFAGGRPVQVVDARDLAGLLKKGVFRRGS